MNPRCLMVIIPDRLSLIVAKGEITPRYYNPGELFSEVHIVMTNDDKVHPSDLQKTVGRAKLYVHNLPADRRLFFKTLGYRPWLLNRWAEAGVRLAQQVLPCLVRCHGNGLNGFVAARIKRKLGVPLVVSMHGNPDVDFRGPLAKSIRQKIYAEMHKAVERASLKCADHFIAVYSSILPYFSKNGMRQYSLIHNAVGYSANVKVDYRLSKPIRCLCVGRQQSLQKDPRHIIEAIAELPDVELTLIGTGDLHDYLVQLAQRLECDTRCKFITRMVNEQVLTEMFNADVYVFNLISLGISKTMIEAALVGLPIIVNRGPDGTAAELDGDWLVLVDDTKEGYLKGLRRLLSDQGERERLGRLAHDHARRCWAPVTMESQVVDIYRQLMGEA